MSKNICLITESLFGGGIERVVLTLATTLSKLGHCVHVIVLSNTVDYPLDNMNFKVHIIDRKKHPIRLIQRLKRSKDLQKKIKKINIKFDLSISNFISVDEVCKQAKLTNLYFVIHGVMSIAILGRYQNTKGLKKLRRRIKHPFLIKQLYKNQNLIAVSNGVKDDLISFGIKANDIKTIYNPFDFADITQQAQEYNIEDKNYVIHMGRFVASKRHDVLIKAYKKSKIQEKLLLLGDDNNLRGEQTKQLIIDLDLQNQVIFKGFVSNPYPHVKNAKALILSSDDEGLPMVLIEALVLDVPIVSTDCPVGPGEILTDDLEMFLSPVGDSDALAKNIKKVIQNPPKIVKKHYEKFSAKNCAEQYLALCND